MNRLVRETAHAARRACGRLGFDLVRAPKRGREQRQVALLKSTGTTLVLDVGANIGQYAQGLRRRGYAGRIVSFEPLSKAFARLMSTAAGDDRWATVNLALGAENGSATIHVAENSYSSSMLPMRPEHLEAAPDSGYVGTERVALATLDTILPEHARPDDRVFLKIDTQGFEGEVLAGARASLDRVVGVQLELSLVPLYEHSMVLTDALLVMREAGFKLVDLQPGFFHPVTGQLLQCDGLFIRDERAR